MNRISDVKRRPVSFKKRRNKEIIFDWLARNGITTKRCRDCGEEKDVTQFSFDRSKGDGLCIRCKACGKLAMKEYHHDTRDLAWKTKACVVCGKTKGVNDFARNLNKEDHREVFCRVCKKQYWESIREKACVRCGEVKLVEEFRSHRTGKDGRASECRACERRRLDVKEAKRVVIYRATVRDALDVMGVCVDCGSPSEALWPPERGRNWHGGLTFAVAKRVLADPVIAKRDLVPLCLSCYRKRKKEDTDTRWVGVDAEMRESVAKILGVWCIDCLGEGRKTFGTSLHHRFGDGHIHASERGKGRLSGYSLRWWVIRNPEEAKERLVPLCPSCHQKRHSRALRLIGRKEQDAVLAAEKELRIRIEAEVEARLSKRKSRQSAPDDQTLFLFQEM